jgi:N-acetylglucosamine kinase-like BadF-type ATPase
MFVLGVDGGTTKTVALVADRQGHIVAFARGGGSNWAGEDVEIPMQVVIGVVNAALAKAGIQGAEVECGVFTLAGADWPEDHTRREAVLRQAGICRRVIVKNDSFGGLRAGSNQPFGMVIAAGTGINAAVITPAGQEWAFGYYETFGGAGTIARDAYAAVLRAADGRGQPTSLTELVLAWFELDSVEALVRASVARRLEPRRFYSISPLVFAAALQGDAVAVAIIVRQGKGLAEYATAMARRFQMQALAFDVVLAGSVFKGAGPLLIDTIRQEIHQVAPLANIVRAQYEPVAGSVLLAWDAAGLRVDEDMVANLRETMPGESFFSTLSSDGLTPVYADEE